MPRPLPCPERCNVLLIGGGGREHALAWKISQSPRLGQLWATDTTNAGLAALAKPFPEAFEVTNQFATQRWIEQTQIHLVVVGPEAPLAAGIADQLQTDTCQVFGPSKAAAMIEADKVFAKQVMRQAAIPTAEAREFDDVRFAHAYVRAREEPCVIKATGLAAGKGVFVCDSTDEALDAIERLLVHQDFGNAGKRILIEEKLSGQEVSVLALVDGRNLWVLDPCQDHKQVGEGDTGPNTGGMGAYCPTPLMDDSILQVIQRDILVPTVDALRREGIEYRGVLYAGLMLTPGGPKVLEFNCRFGDPECQPLLMRLQTDLIELLWATCTGRLDDIDVNFDPRPACCVVMCSKGYPGSYNTNAVITGVNDVMVTGVDDDEVRVFHAGTKFNDQDELITTGGRVLGVTAIGSDLQAARDRANEACSKIHFDGAFYRRDIGDRVLIPA